MQVTGEAMMTERIFRDRMRAIARGVLISSRVVGALTALFGLCLIIPLDRVGVPVGLVMLTAGLAIGVFMPWRLVSLSVKRSRPMLVQPWRYEFTDEGVSVHNAIGTGEFPWSSLVGVTDHAEFWVLHTPVKQQSILVTKAAFSAEDKRVLAEQLPRRVGGATKVA